nr:GIY-YIG nuclease family protein [Brucella intermedia]
MSEKKEGYVYVLSNPAIPGLVKIGRTTRRPSDRVRELNSASGVALPFKLEASIRTKYPNWTEKLLHLALDRYRVNQKREFFELSVDEAVAICRRCVRMSKAEFLKSVGYKPKVRRRNSISFGFGWLKVPAAIGVLAIISDYAVGTNFVYMLMFLARSMLT